MNPRFRDPIDRAGIIVFGSNVPVVIDDPVRQQAMIDLENRRRGMKDKILTVLESKYTEMNGIESFVERLLKETLPGFSDDVIIRSVIQQVKARFQVKHSDATVDSKTPATSNIPLHSSNNPSHSTNIDRKNAEAQEQLTSYNEGQKYASSYVTAERDHAPDVPYAVYDTPKPLDSEEHLEKQNQLRPRDFLPGSVEEAQYEERNKKHFETIYKYLVTYKESHPEAGKSYWIKPEHYTFIMNALMRAKRNLFRDDEPVKARIIEEIAGLTVQLVKDTSIEAVFNVKKYPPKVNHGIFQSWWGAIDPVF